MVDMRKQKERKTEDKPKSIKIVDKEIWRLLKKYNAIYLRNDREGGSAKLTEGEYIESLIKKDLKEKKENGELDKIRDLSVLDG
jgi:hypothetical protein